MCFIVNKNDLNKGVHLLEELEIYKLIHVYCVYTAIGLKLTVYFIDSLVYSIQKNNIFDLILSSMGML